MTPLVYIILVNYRTPAETIACVGSIERSDYAHYRIVIVDNASPDDSVAQLRQRCGDHIIIALDHNGGFARGCNAGIARAQREGAEYVLLLNGDTTVEPEALRELVTALERDPRAAAAGPLIYYAGSKRIWFAGGTLDLTRFVTRHPGAGIIDDGRFGRERSVTFLIGCCMMLRMDALRKVGLLDERFFLYFEDTDLCLRLQETGYTLLFTPRAVIHHTVSSSMGGELSPFSLEWWTRSRRRFMAKHHHHLRRPLYDLMHLYFWATRLLYVIGYYLTGRPSLSRAVLKALRDG